MDYHYYIITKKYSSDYRILLLIGFVTYNVLFILVNVYLIYKSNLHIFWYDPKLFPYIYTYDTLVTISFFYKIIVITVMYLD